MSRELWHIFALKPGRCHVHWGGAGEMVSHPVFDRLAPEMKSYCYAEEVEISNELLVGFWLEILWSWSWVECRDGFVTWEWWWLMTWFPMGFNLHGFGEASRMVNPLHLKAWQSWWDMGVNPKIGGFYPPKWMVKIMENPIKMDDLGGPPLFLETPIWLQSECFTGTGYFFLWTSWDVTFEAWVLCSSPRGNWRMLCLSSPKWRRRSAFGELRDLCHRFGKMKMCPVSLRYPFFSCRFCEIAKKNRQGGRQQHRIQANVIYFFIVFWVPYKQQDSNL